MGVMIDGEWEPAGWPRDDSGNFRREKTSFRESITAAGESGLPVEAGRYHLYISWACPWASRAVIMRALKGLEAVVSLSVVDSFMGDDGWFFSGREGSTLDQVNQTKYLREIYRLAASDYTGRVTVPVLWDKQRETIVNNESLEIMRMFDLEFEEFAVNSGVFYPAGYEERIDSVIKEIYRPINNGVYRAGFASTQEAYEAAFKELFEALEHWEEVLDDQRYLCGSVLTEADICMFTTLYRFDAVYHTHFKCNKKRIIDYPNLWNYLREIYQIPPVKDNCRMDHVKEHYYRSHSDINPYGIIPSGPEIDFDLPHNRARLAAAEQPVE